MNWTEKNDPERKLDDSQEKKMKCRKMKKNTDRNIFKAVGGGWSGRVIGYAL